MRVCQAQAQSFDFCSWLLLLPLYLCVLFGYYLNKLTLIQQQATGTLHDFRPLKPVDWQPTGNRLTGALGLRLAVEIQPARAT